MPGRRARVFSREFKEAAVRRILAGERVQALADEFKVWPKLPYAWRNSYEWGGADALLPPGRPRRSAGWANRPQPVPSARPDKAQAKAKGKHRSLERETESERVADLERKVGQQALELDFFREALRHVKEPPRPSGGRGAGASSR